jgi:hypothetical protein
VEGAEAPAAQSVQGGDPSTDTGDPHHPLRQILQPTANLWRMRRKCSQQRNRRQTPVESEAFNDASPAPEIPTTQVYF